MSREILTMASANPRDVEREMKTVLCFCYGAFHRYPLVSNAPGTDDTLASTYELNIDNEYLPLGIYTLEVDYPDPDVQVRRSRRAQYGS